MLTKLPNDKKFHRAIPIQLVQDARPDRTYYLRHVVGGFAGFFSNRLTELYNTLALTFSLDSFDWHHFKKYVWPAISSGAALLMGDYLTRGLSEALTGDPEYDFVVKFLLGAATLGYCSLNRITERKFRSHVEFSAAVASEILAILYMYSSVYKGTNFLLDGHISADYALIASLGTSALVVPGVISFATQKVQEHLVRAAYGRGAQRSDTAIISSGLTPVSNLYFQFNHFLASELVISSRAFQLGLISHNMYHAVKLLQRFRNLPALLADLAPSTIKKLRIQQDKLRHDDEYNHKIHRVLRFTEKGSMFINVPRYQLQTGDLVYCDKSIDFACVPLSGELVALKRDTKGQFVSILEQRKFSVNLKAQNGEDVWIEHHTKQEFGSPYKKVVLLEVRDGKQAGVLVGDKLNIFDSDNIFIQIKPEQELLLSSNYEKKAVINEIITDRKQRTVLYSILGSIVMAAVLQRDITLWPAETLRLMFTLFQTMIPFSETFLRETINSQLMKQLNANLGDQPLEPIDALRVVDLCNALGGYYRERFPKGVAIISDKTGTLTTNTMNVLGLWTTGMNPEVQKTLKETSGLLLPQESQWLNSFELFCCAYTHSKKDLEPEEYAILDTFKGLLRKEHCLEVHTYGNHHFQKIIHTKDVKKEIETFHLGLYRCFGGRLTLVKEGKDYSLVFCGVPRPEAFANTPLLQAYTSMARRTGVLSRDWCLAKASLNEGDFSQLQQLFSQDDKKGIELFLKQNDALFKALQFQCTFIIDNPVKKGADKFISQCQDISVPVFIATGDTTKAAENIAKVLCPESAHAIQIIRATDNLSENKGNYLPNSTVIFSGVNDAILAKFQQFMDMDRNKRPVMIFAEMSTEGKGILSRYLKQHRYFVVANGDGTNDVMMMKNSNMVIAHQSDDGSFAPGVGALSNISEGQVRQLFGVNKSFYELFDIHVKQSRFIQRFTPLANSQEKPSMALALKSEKMTFDLASSVGVNVKEMNHQHWYSVAFDMIWLWISFYEINQTVDLPMDNRNINVSNLISQTMELALMIAIVQAFVNYTVYDESTNLASMVLMLSILPLVLKSVFSGFRSVQERFYPQVHEPKQEQGGLFRFFHQSDKKDTAVSVTPVI